MRMHDMLVDFFESNSDVVSWGVGAVLLASIIGLLVKQVFPMIAGTDMYGKIGDAYKKNIGDPLAASTAGKWVGKQYAAGKKQYDRFGNWVGQGWTDAKDYGAGKYGELGTWASPHWESTKKYVSDHGGSRIAGAYNSVIDALKSVYKSLIDGGASARSEAINKLEKMFPKWGDKRIAARTAAAAAAHKKMRDAANPSGAQKYMMDKERQILGAGTYSFGGALGGVNPAIGGSAASTAAARAAAGEAEEEFGEARLYTTAALPDAAPEREWFTASDPRFHEKLAATQPVFLPA